MAVTTSRGPDPHPTDQRTLRTFFVATFALSWGVGVLLSVLPALVPALLQRWMAPLWSSLLLGVPDAQPWDMSLVAVVHRTTMLSRAAGHTTVLFDAGPVTARP